MKDLQEWQKFQTENNLLRSSLSNYNLSGDAICGESPVLLNSDSEAGGGYFEKERATVVDIIEEIKEERRTEVTP